MSSPSRSNEFPETMIVRGHIMKKLGSFDAAGAAHYKKGNGPGVWVYHVIKYPMMWGRKKQTVHVLYGRVDPVKTAKYNKMVREYKG